MEDYKKYSLEQLKNWVADSLTSGGATPSEIWESIYEAIKEEYYVYKHHSSRAYELMCLLNKEESEKLLGLNNDFLTKDRNSNFPNENTICDRNDQSEECKKSWTSFWEENYCPEEYKKSKVEYIMPSWGHSDMEALRYTEEELNAMCDKAASDDEKEKCRKYNLREAEYYNKRAEIDAKMGKNWKPVSVEGAPVYVSEDGNVFVHDYYNTKEDKVVKWQLPVQVDGLTGDCFIEFPDDLLETSGLKEGDVVEWIDRKDGSFELRKVNGPK